MKRPVIIGVSASKMHDNAEKLLEAALRGCREENFDTKLILLREKDASYFDEFIAEVIAAEGVIISLPVREQTDLLNALIGYLKECSEKPLLLGKKAAFIITGPILDELKNKLFELENTFAELGFDVERSATVVDRNGLSKDDIGFCVIIGRNIAKVE